MDILNIEYGSAKMTVRRATVLDNLNLARIFRKIQPFIENDADLDTLSYEWGLAVTRTVALEGVDYTLPQATDTAENLYISLNSYILLADDLVRAWQSGIKQANLPQNEAKFTPSLAWNDATDPNSLTPDSTIGQTLNGKSAVLPTT